MNEFNVLKKIGYLVRFYRRQNFMSQFQMADALQISHRGLQRLEAGKHEPKLETLQKISDLLQIPISALLRTTTQDTLLVKEFSTGDELLKLPDVLRNSAADISFAKKLLREDQGLPEFKFHAELDASRVWLSPELGTLTGEGLKIDSIDSHVLYGSSFERWELVFRLNLKKAVIQNHYMFASGYKVFEEYHYDIRPNPDVPTSKCFIRDITHKHELENWIRNAGRSGLTKG